MIKITVKKNRLTDGSETFDVSLLGDWQDHNEATVIPCPNESRAMGLAIGIRDLIQAKSSEPAEIEFE